jgi:hypothetical protein
MTTIQFHTPDYVKKQFLDTFEGENKGKILTRLMCEAVEKRKLERRRDGIVQRIKAWFFQDL